jgi:hypothetical protein
MRTFNNFLRKVAIVTIGVGLIVGSTSVNAQNKNGHNNGNQKKEKGWEKENRNKKEKHDYYPDKREYQHEYDRYSYHEKNNQHYYPKHNYNKRAPWGHHQPIVMNHGHGQVYFFDGHCYEYYPNRGYVMINIPVNYIFNEIPYECRKVWIAGNYFYKYEDIYFKPSIHGYVVIPNPWEINFTARF